MEIRKRFFKNIAVLYVSGNIDIDAAELIEETGRLVKEGITKVLCDFTNVNVMDYSGLSIMAIAYKNITNQDGVLKFCNIPQHIKELLKAARLDLVFDIYDDEEGALRSFDLTDKVDRLSLRRRFKRIDIGIPVKYKLGIATDSTFYRGKVLNISGEGLFIYSKKTYPASTPIYLEIELGTGHETIMLMGDVVWLADKSLQLHSYPGMGIKFSAIDPKAQEKVIDFIDKNLTRRSKT